MVSVAKTAAQRWLMLAQGRERGKGERDKGERGKG
jgi:hypothetical protein